MEQLVETAPMIAQSETLIERELKKFNVTEAAISELRVKYLPLTIKGLDDKEGAKLVREARLTIKGERVRIQKTGKELRGDAVAFQKAVIAEENKIVASLSEIESHLENEEAKIEQEKEKIRQEQERQRQELIQKRVGQLLASGMSFNGESYSIGSIVVRHVELETLMNETFEDILTAAKEEQQKELDRQAEIERQRQEEEARIEKTRLEQKAEADRLEALRREQEEREAKFRAEQAAAAKAQAEKEAAIRAEQNRIEQERLQAENNKRQARFNALFAVGMVNDGEFFRYNDLKVQYEELADLSAVQFEERVSLLGAGVTKIKAEEEQARQAEIKAAQKAAAEQARKEAEAKAKKEAEEKAASEAKAKAAAERKAALAPDKEKLAQMAKSFETFAFPEVKSPEAQMVVDQTQGLIAKVVKYINENSEKI